MGLHRGSVCSSGIFYWSPRGTAKGVVQALFEPQKDPQNGNRRFVMKASFNRGSSLYYGREPLSSTVSTLKCYRLMFSTLSGTRARDFDPEAVRRASPKFSYGSPPSHPPGLQHCPNLPRAHLWTRDSNSKRCFASYPPFPGLGLSVE